MNTIYCISGLGADERAFAKLHINGFLLHLIPWVDPIKNEAIESYAARMSKQIKEDNPILLGLSFGGIMCIEIAKQRKVRQIILISSVKTSAELPAWMKLVAKSKLNKIYPMKSYKITAPIQNYFLGASTKDEKDMANAYRQQAKMGYTNWAVNEVLNWKNEWMFPRCFHIHGAEDKIFPIKNIKADMIIEGGGHFMIMNKAAEVSDAIQMALNSIC